MNQFPLSELQAPSVLQSMPVVSSLGQFPPQQQQPSLVTNVAGYPNQTFNVQTPQFNKNFISNPSLQQFALYGNGEPPAVFSANTNVNQGRLLQQHQQQQQQQIQPQQRPNFGNPAMSQNNGMMNQGLNMMSPVQQQQKPPLGKHVLSKKIC